MPTQKKIKLADFPTRAPKGWGKKETKKKTKELVKRLGALHHTLYAEGKHSVLVIFQGMDASGKDGAVRNVFSKCTIAGLNIKSFKKPTEEEFAHDFLWRVHKEVPRKGMMTLFNRSHYEDILIQRVHGWISNQQVDMRIDAINAFEKLLHVDNNTHIFKFYMHTSYDEQKKQLQERLDDPTKHWKHNPGDWEQRKYWKQYMAAYEDAINRSAIPWYICPVDNRWYRDYVVAKTMVDYLEKLEMKLPALKET